MLIMDADKFHDLQLTNWRPGESWCFTVLNANTAHDWLFAYTSVWQYAACQE